MSRVKTPACRPNLESLAISSASPKSEKRSIVATGPKISSHQTFASRGGWAITVGARQRSSSTSSPPVRTSPPLAAASSTHSLTRSRSSGEISGPTSVSASSGSPTTSDSAFATKRSVKASAISSCRRMRWIEMQLWPACEKAWSFALSAAVSQSPSALTISGAFEPSSRLTFLWGTLLRIPQPTGAEPVKVIALVSSLLDDRVADLRARAGDDAQPALGQAGLEQDPGQLERRDRGLPGRLQHDRVAGGDRRAELVGDEVEREVEGADRADDPVGHPHHHAELAGARCRGLHRDGAAGQLAGLDRGEGERLDAARAPRPWRSSAACRPRRRSSAPARRPARRRAPAARSSTAARSCWGKPPPAKASWAAVDRALDQGGVALGDPARRRCRRRGSRPRPIRRSRATRRRPGACDRRLDRLRRHAAPPRRFLGSSLRRAVQRPFPGGALPSGSKVFVSGDDPNPARPPRSRSRSSLALALGMRCSAPAAERGGQVGGQGPRLRPRGGHEPVRRLRLRPPRQGPPVHPPPLLPRDPDRTSWPGPASSACCSTSTGGDVGFTAARAPAGGGSTPTATTRPIAAATGSACEPAAASCWRAAAASCGRRAAGGSGSAATAPTAGRLEVVPTGARRGAERRSTRSASTST